MDWNEAGEENRKALRRIVALLLSLAGLAECAAGRSRAVCGLVLWLLRPAEEIARNYVADLTGSMCAPPIPAAIPIEDDSREGAMRLALSFRTLAAILAALTPVEAGRAGARILCFLARSLADALPAPGDCSGILAAERIDSS